MLLSVFIPRGLEGFRFKMAAVESLEDEALKRRERLKALRKKSGLPDQEVDQVFKILSPSPFMWNIVFAVNT